MFLRKRDQDYKKLISQRAQSKNLSHSARSTVNETLDITHSLTLLKLIK
jgi:hypothetical protein